MTKYLAIIFTFFTMLSGVELTISSGMLDSESYSVLSIKNSEEFNCINTATSKNPQDRYICKFKNIPLTYPYKTENKFFSINPVIEKNMMFIEIVPKKSSYIKPLKVKNQKSGLSSSWIIIGYENKLPFIMSKESRGLNFPVNIETNAPMYVGLLDMDKKPFNENQQEREIRDFLKVKKLYEESRYEDIIFEVDAAIKYSSNSLFLPELLVYKLRALSTKKGKEHGVVDAGEVWIETFTTHKDLPEIMLLVAKANIDLGYSKEANYYIDILIQDYKKSLFSQMAMIYKADRLKIEMKEDKAIALYKKVLVETADLRIASIAASRLAKIYISLGEIDRGIEYYGKVFKSNPEFFVEAPLGGYELALSITSYSKFSLAAGISDLVLAKLDKTEDIYKEVMLNSARWHARAAETPKAKERYESYMKKYPFEDNTDQIKAEYDNLFFDLKDDNVTSKIAGYDNLISTYGDEEIGKKAFHEKVVLLADEERYDDVRGLLGLFTGLERSMFPDIDIESAKIINDMFFYYLASDRCSDVIDVYKNYDVTIDSIYDEKIYNCLYNGFEYKMADNLCDKNIEESSGPFAIEWIGKKIDIADKTGDAKRVVIVSEDYMKAMKLYEKNISLEKYMKILKALYDQKEYSGVLDVVSDIEKLYPEALNIAEVYSSAIKAFQKLEDMTRVLLYASKLFEYQNDKEVYIYTPWVEFTYSDVLTKMKRYKEAIAVLQQMLQNEIKIEERARALYMLSNTLDMLGMFDVSKDVLKRCVNLKSDDKFSRLCKESIEILEN